MKYTQRFKYFACVSALIIIAGIIMALTMRPNIGDDFSGGHIITIELGSEFETADVSAALAANRMSHAAVVKTGLSADKYTQAVVRVKAFADEESKNAASTGILDALKAKYPNASIVSTVADEPGIEKVGPTAGWKLIGKAALYIVVAAVVVLAYMWIRFGLRSGITTVIVILHDIVVMLALTVLLRIQMNTTVIVSAVVVMLYAVNNSSILFDKIRENKKMLGKNQAGDAEGLVNSSIDELRTRFVFTAMIGLVIVGLVYILCSGPVRAFALAVILGLIVGTYSSVFLAAPFWAMLEKKVK